MPELELFLDDEDKVDGYGRTVGVYGDGDVGDAGVADDDV